MPHIHIPLGRGYILSYPRLLHYFFYGASAYCAASLFKHHVASWSSSQGPSMYPTFAAEETISMISHLHRYGRGCKVGDVIQLRSPLFPGKKAGKRILGMPGDYVVVDGDMSVGVGGVETEVMRGKDLKGGRREEPRMLQVPEGHLWVAGDNMAWSRDSRFYGAVPMALVEGKIFAHRGRGGWFDWTYLGEEGQLREVPVDEESVE